MLFKMAIIHKKILPNLDALERRFNDKNYDAPALADLHIWLLLFIDDFALISKSEMGLQQQLDTFQ